MEFNRKNVRMILLIIAFAVVLYTAAQNLASVYGACLLYTSRCV